MQLEEIIEPVIPSLPRSNILHSYRMSLWDTDMTVKAQGISNTLRIPPAALPEPRPSPSALPPPHQGTLLKEDHVS